MTRAIVCAVYREERFSPGKVRNDAAILDASLALLPASKNTIHTLRPDQLSGMTAIPDLVLSMAQSEQALAVLDGWRREGARIINSVSAVENCYRKALIRRLQDARIPMPSGAVVRLEEVEGLLGGGGPWLKRGDVHAMQPGDVARVKCGEDLAAALMHFRAVGVEEVLVQEHVRGAVIKFYGVGPGDYFAAFETATGKRISSRAGNLRDIANLSAEAVGLEIFGGDAVLTPGGNAVIIDLNDWPSFSACRADAARCIAEHATRSIHG